MANDVPKLDAVENAAGETTVALGVLRDEALEELFERNTRSTYESSASHDGTALTIQTKDEHDGSDSTLIINGEENSADSLLALNVNGNYTIQRIEDGNIEGSTAHYYMRYAHVDWARSLPHYQVSMSRHDGAGNPLEVYNPANSHLKSEAGELVYDNNLQPMREATLTDGINCSPDYRRRTLDCSFLVDDSKLGTLSFNESRKGPGVNGNNNSRFVVRTPEGKVLAILNQDYKLDANGHLESVTTTARRPKGYKAE